MKKIIRFVICVFVLCTLCISVTVNAASNDQVAEDLKNCRSETEPRFQNYLNLIAVKIPVEKSDAFINSLWVDLGPDGIVAFLSAADIKPMEGHERDGFTVVPLSPEYIEKITVSLMKQYPDLNITQRPDENYPQDFLDVVLPEVNDTLFKLYQAYLNDFLNKEVLFISINYKKYVESIVRHGGKMDDLNELSAIFEEFQNNLERVRQEKSEQITELHKQYTAKHSDPNKNGDDGNLSSGFFLSEGKLTIIVSVATAVIFGVGGFFLGRKKKNPTPADGDKDK